MFSVRIAGAMVALCLLTFATGGEPNPAKLVGVWEVVRSPEAAPGSTVEFTKDGKLILTAKGKDGKKMEATYKVEGKKLTTTRKEKGKEEVNVLTIQTLTETTMTTLNEKGSVDELKRLQSK